MTNEVNVFRTFEHHFSALECTKIARIGWRLVDQPPGRSFRLQKLVDRMNARALLKPFDLAPALGRIQPVKFHQRSLQPLGKIATFKLLSALFHPQEWQEMQLGRRE